MATIKEFQGLRPIKELAHLIAELPYDVVSSDEARHIASGRRYSFYHVSKPEIDLPSSVNPYDDMVYEKGKENLDAFINQGFFLKDSTPVFYLYSQVMEGRMQTGLVAGVSIDDYINNTVKKHELTREDKELDRMKHIDVLNAQTGLVFLMYRQDSEKRNIFSKAMNLPAEYDFITDDGVRHILRVITDRTLIEEFRKTFANTQFYIADGHHRAASAVRIGQKRRQENGGKSGEYDYFMAAIFPHDELKILPYHRAVKDLNGLSFPDFLALTEKKFKVQKTDADTPPAKNHFCMYAGGSWYLITPKFEISSDPIESLDVKILQDHILRPILGIQDPRTDKRIDFIGGIRGTGYLKKIVDDGSFAVAFSMYPTSVDDLMAVSDKGSIMPPKSTWFEPKLLDALVIHEI